MKNKSNVNMAKIRKTALEINAKLRPSTNKPGFLPIPQPNDN